MEIGDWRPLFPTRVGEELGDIGAARFNIYNKELESQLIMATSEFYARESSQWIGTDSCPEYMKKVPGLCFGIPEKLFSPHLFPAFILFASVHASPYEFRFYCILALTEILLSGPFSFIYLNSCVCPCRE